MNSQDIDKRYKVILYLLLAHFFVGLVFDFSSTLYGFYIRTSLYYPGLGDLSMGLWLFITGIIFLKLLNQLGYNKLTPWLLAMYFFLFYGAGIHDAGNSVQLKLWLLGYNEEPQFFETAQKLIS